MAPKVEIEEVITDIRVSDDESSLQPEKLERLADAVADRLEERRRQRVQHLEDTRIGEEEG